MTERDSIGLHNLPRPVGATKEPKRKGRGPGSGLGKTAGRGENGQRSRSGGGVRPGFEGGQMPLIRRVPKRGFRNPFQKRYQIVNLRDLDRLSGNAVTPNTLTEAGLVNKADKPVKILGYGAASKAYKVSGCKMSKTAHQKIGDAGGNVEA